MSSIPGELFPGIAKRGQVFWRALALLAITLACSFAIPFPAHPTAGTSATEAPLGLIALVGKDGNIYTANGTGKKRSAITRDANLKPGAGQAGRIYQYPTWAPDGRHLAFVSFGLDASGPEVALYSALSDGGERIKIFTSEKLQPFYLSWSPDSRTIAFLGSDSAGDLAQYLVGGSGGAAKLAGSGQPYYWDWSPDSQTMIVHIGGASSDNPAARLAFIKLDGSSSDTQLDLKPGSFEAPAWSPAGDELALAAQNGAGKEELVLAGRDGKKKQVLASLSGSVAFGWSPKGVQLAYAVLDPSGSVPTIRLNVLDTSKPAAHSQITEGDLLAFFWSPDGRKIAYFTRGSEGPTASSVHLVGLAKARVSLAVRVYDRVSGETKQVAQFTPTDSFQQILPFYSQYQRSGTIWSPDSQTLVLSGVDQAGTDGIYTVGVDGSHYQKIADGDLAFWSWK